MTGRAPLCAVTRYLPDGTAVTDWWKTNDDQIAAVYTLLGEPDIRVDGRTMYDGPPPQLRRRRRDWLRHLRRTPNPT